MNEIHDLLAARVAAMREGDVETLIGQYAPEIVKYDLAPPLANPAPRDADALKLGFGSFDGPVDYSLHSLVVTASADVAFAHGLCRLRAPPLGSPEPFHIRTP